MLLNERKDEQTAAATAPDIFYYNKTDGIRICGFSCSGRFGLIWAITTTAFPCPLCRCTIVSKHINAGVVTGKGISIQRLS